MSAQQVYPPALCYENTAAVRQYKGGRAGIPIDTPCSCGRVQVYASVPSKRGLFSRSPTSHSSWRARVMATYKSFASFLLTP